MMKLKGHINYEVDEENKTVRVDMEKLVRAVEKITGETFMVETITK